MLYMLLRCRLEELVHAEPWRLIARTTHDTTLSAGVAVKARVIAVQFSTTVGSPAAVRVQFNYNTSSMHYDSRNPKSEIRNPKSPRTSIAA